MFAKWLLALIGALIFGSAAHAGASDGPKVEVELIAPMRSITPGRPFQIGLKERIRKNWHTYWKNPGDSGEPTRITWDLPNGFSASPINWPIPKAIPYGPLMNYGYSDEVLLPVTITPPDVIDERSITIKGKADWLVCERICIPETQDVSITLPIAPSGSEGLPSRHASLFNDAERVMPIEAPWQASIGVGKEKVVLSVDAPQLRRDRITHVAFFPNKRGLIDHAAKQFIIWTGEGLKLTTKRADPDLSIKDFSPFEGVLVLTEKLDGKTVRNGFLLSAKASPVTDQAINALESQAHAPTKSISLWQALIFALLGGMILNLMPCVLPILSLKVVSLATHHGDESGKAAKASGLWYLTGVMVSFAFLALLVVALKSAGVALGWGFQFQSPLFVLIMAGVFFLLGLSLSGVFEIGAGIVGMGEGLTRQAGPRGSFFTGALASVAATPCTAPFMGAALGYALSRSAFELFAVLQALGLGFALPMLLLSVSGTAAKLLPKPGPWMETLKQVLAFPMYATVGWLIWVLSIQTGSEGVLGAAIVLVTLGFAAWLIGCTNVSMWLRVTIAALVVVPALALAVPMMSATATPAKSFKASSEKGRGLDYEVFSTKRLAELRAQGRPVFVNLTAAWCITCKVNEQLALSSKRFHDAMKKNNVAYLKGDWTRQDPEITSVLKSFQRSGVPLYLLYPADRNTSPVVLPQLLTEAIVLGHINRLSDKSENAQAGP